MLSLSDLPSQVNLRYPHANTSSFTAQQQTRFTWPTFRPKVPQDFDLLRFSHPLSVGGVVRVMFNSPQRISPPRIYFEVVFPELRSVFFIPFVRVKLTVFRMIDPYSDLMGALQD